MKQAREVALDALTACERQGAWSDGYLKKAIGGAKLDGRDAALATRSEERRVGKECRL